MEIPMQVMSHKCRKCRRMVTYTESDVKSAGREWESHSELIHSNYKWITCPYCGKSIYLGEAGWSL